MKTEQIFSSQKKIMGTFFHCITIAENDMKELFSEIETEIRFIESLFSRFQKTSIVSLLNTEKTTTVPDIFQEVFAVCSTLYTYTNKTYNPLLSPFFLGYKENFNADSIIPSEFPQGYDTFFENITIKNSVLSLKENQYIDFGGMLKGWTAAYIADKYGKKCNGLLINIGGDIATRGNDLEQDSFAMSFYNPITQKDIPIFLHNQSLATSGTYKRKWNSGNHIVTPNTQASNSDIISATIVHENGGFADALATCAIVWGREKAITFFTSEKINYALIDNQGNVLSNI